MSLYAVGKLYHEGRTQWPEWAEYNYRAGAHELRVFYKSPTKTEVEAVEAGPCRFAIYPYMDVIFFCYKFGELPWSDSGYSVHLVPEDERQLPPDPSHQDERALLTTFFVDADTGILAALRVVSFSPQFTRALHAAIWQQYDRPFPGRHEIDRQGHRVYAQHTSKDIAQRLALARCKGGD